MNEVQQARLLVQRLDESGEAPAGGMLSDRMHDAALKLQERMANLDHQWQRAIMLDAHGIFVYDEQGPNKGRPDVWLFPDAKRWNDRLVRNYSEERRQIMARCDLPRLGTAPPPRVEAAASATSSHPNDYPDNRTPTPPPEARGIHVLNI